MRKYLYFTHCFNSQQQPCAVGAIIISLLQMGKLRPDEVKQHPQVIQLVKWHSVHSKPKSRSQLYIVCIAHHFSKEEKEGEGNRIYFV